MTRRLPTTSSYTTRIHTSSYLQHQRSILGRSPHPFFNDIQALHHEKPTLDAREVTKLLRRDTTSSYDEFPRYAQPYKLIPTTSTTHPVDNNTLDLYCEGATLSKLIHEGRPTTTKRLSLLFEPSDETIRRLYDIPINKNYIDDH